MRATFPWASALLCIVAAGATAKAQSYYPYPPMAPNPYGPDFYAYNDFGMSNGLCYYYLSPPLPPPSLPDPALAAPPGGKSSTISDGIVSSSPFEVAPNGGADPQGRHGWWGKRKQQGQPCQYGSPPMNGPPPSMNGPVPLPIHVFARGPRDYFMQD